MLWGLNVLELLEQSIKSAGAMFLASGKRESWLIVRKLLWTTSFHTKIHSGGKPSKISLELRIQSPSYVVFVHILKWIHSDFVLVDFRVLSLLLSSFLPTEKCCCCCAQQQQHLQLGFSTTNMRGAGFHFSLRRRSSFLRPSQTSVVGNKSKGWDLTDHHCAWLISNFQKSYIYPHICWK